MNREPFRSQLGDAEVAELRALLTRRIKSEGHAVSGGVDAASIAIEILALLDELGEPAREGVRFRGTVEEVALRTGRTRAEIVHAVRLMRMLGWAELGRDQITLLRARER